MKESFDLPKDSHIDFEIFDWMINFMHKEVAIVSGTIRVTTISKDGEDLPAVKISIEQRREGQEKISLNYRALRSDGIYCHIRLNSSMTERSKDEIIYYGIITDVDEMIKMQETAKTEKASSEELGKPLTNCKRVKIKTACCICNRLFY